MKMINAKLCGEILKLLLESLLRINFYRFNRLRLVPTCLQF
jgi:hypothetical protein